MVKRRNKKAQAAMEFLTTYGWAILILLIVIVALANLGVFKAKGTVSACIPIAPFSGCDVNLALAGVGNEVGVAISTADTLTPVQLISINGLTIQGAGDTCTLAGPVAISINQATGKGSNTFACTDAPLTGTVGDDYKANIVVSYIGTTGLSKQVTMQVQGKLV